MKQLLQTDKLLHNLINYIIVFTLSVLTSYWIGLTTAIVVSLIKEFVWDKLLKKGCFEIMDLISNTLGIIEATLIYLIYYLWIL
jgi:glycopeptide antibiotics resistance protein